MNQAQIHLVELCGSRLFLSYSSVCVCVSCVTVLKREQVNIQNRSNDINSITVAFHSL